MKLSYKYKDELTPLVINKRNLDIIPTGIYVGLSPQYTVGQNIITFTPGVIETKGIVENTTDVIQVRIEFKNSFIVDTVQIKNTLNSQDFYIVSEYIYADDENRFADIKGILVTNYDENKHIKLCKVTTDTNGQIVSVSENVGDRDLIIGLMGQKIYDSNNNGIIDNSEKIDGKSVIGGQDIIDNQIDPTTIPDYIVSLDDTGKFPPNLITKFDKLKLFTEQKFLYVLTNQFSVSTKVVTLDLSNDISSDAKGVVLKIRLRLTGFNGGRVIINDMYNNLVTQNLTYSIVPGNQFLFSEIKTVNYGFFDVDFQSKILQITIKSFWGISAEYDIYIYGIGEY